MRTVAYDRRSMSTVRLTPTSYVVLGLVEQLGTATPYDLKRAALAGVGHFWSLPHTQLYSEPARLAAAGYLDEEREPKAGAGGSTRSRRPEPRRSTTGGGTRPPSSTRSATPASCGSSSAPIRPSSPRSSSKPTARTCATSSGSRPSRGRRRFRSGASPPRARRRDRPRARVRALLGRLAEPAGVRGDVAGVAQRRLPAGRRPGGVEANARDHHVRVARVRVDGDPLARPGIRPRS